MSIQILPARLANQIAAGEVVERPASVVKELVENSLDSGATRIDIDIEKGGSKLIRVRDNGKGIIKQELTLALSRHATSKIKCLDDLEAIMSLGFRGEALASVSSVSRLTLTSRTATQDQAWSAHSEGRDMDVKLQPSGHPIGTTVEVLDLFFNTPARRKFLRTEKTEFSHIDELLKRIALSRLDVTINLKHNGKMIRQYRAANTEAQVEKRLAVVCGAAFVKEMLSVKLEHQGLKLHGWISSPQGARQQNDLQFCYVNGRMMRDKLINHAIRQSYENSLSAEQFACYVLFIEVDPHQVDVNVHPAKHEVRFHQSRLVHDFIYVALTDVLVQSANIQAPQTNQAAYQTHLEPEPNQQPTEPSFSASDSKPKQDDNPDNYPRRTGYMPPVKPSVTQEERSAYQALLSVTGEKQRESDSQTLAISANDHATNHGSVSPHSPQSPSVSEHALLDSCALDNAPTRIGKALTIIDGQYLLVETNLGLALLSLNQAAWYRVNGQLQVCERSLTPEPLLVPLSIKLNTEAIATYQAQQALLEKFAIQLSSKGSRHILVMAVPQPLRQHNLQLIIADLLSYLSDTQSPISEKSVASWLASQLVRAKSDYTLSEGIQLISELEQLWDGNLPLSDLNFIRSVSFESVIGQFKSESVKREKR